MNILIVVRKGPVINEANIEKKVYTQGTEDKCKFQSLRKEMRRRQRRHIGIPFLYSIYKIYAEILRKRMEAESFENVNDSKIDRDTFGNIFVLNYFI